MENHIAMPEGKKPASPEKEAYIYVVLPFQIIENSVNKSDNDAIKSKGGLFDEVTNHLYSHKVLMANAENLMKKISAISMANTNSSSMPGDFSKYYAFMQNHFGGQGLTHNFSAFILEKSKIKPGQGFKSFRNLHEQFTGEVQLGTSGLRMRAMDEPAILVNAKGGIGFFFFGFASYTNSGNPIDDELANTVFFRNIGWRRNEQDPKPKQRREYAFFFNDKPSMTLNDKPSMTLYEMLQCYFADLSEHIRFYQDRPTVLYSLGLESTGSKKDNELCALAYDIIRVPGRNVKHFEHELTEPKIQRVGRNVAFTAMNEGALIIESINTSTTIKAVANKYLPAFILALNQREILLNTMQNIVQLDTHKLYDKEQDEKIFTNMEHLRNGLLILQLKQIFCSVSNFHEVELFFNHLQKSFAIEKMLIENEQCIRDIHNLLEVRQNRELARIEKENVAKEERRSHIINTILGAIGCLGLFSFLVDLVPFYNDTETYGAWYRLLSISLPVIIMAYIVRLVFYSKD